MDYFERQDQFKRIMLDTYEQHGIPKEEMFAPYFKWKKGVGQGIPPPPTQLSLMKNAAQEIIEAFDVKHPNAWDEVDLNKAENDLLFLYRGYNEDAVIVGIISAIEEELTNIMLLEYGR